MKLPHETLKGLLPTSKTNVMTLLRDAGHEVEYWNRNADGSAVAKPAANPNHCYNWSFGSASEVIVLCVWHSSLRVDKDRIVYVGNMRRLDEQLSAFAMAGGRSPKDRDRARQQATRARAFDSLMHTAYDKLLPIRLIFNEGGQTKPEQLGAESSEVSLRSLDPENWYAHGYDENTGNALLVRGVPPTRDIADVTSGSDETYRGSESERQFKAILVRRGQRDFRDRLLRAWSRRCVVTECRVEGLLEAAHIVPHADETDYRTSNGLLLRADIHTLYDLGLISIDEYMRIHVVASIRVSEYAKYEGKQIERRPDAGADAPSAEGLRKRHQKFLEVNYGASVA